MKMYVKINNKVAGEPFRVKITGDIGRDVLF